MSLRHAWSVVNPKEANTFPRRGNTMKDIWNVTKKLYIKWVIEIIDQSQVAIEEAYFIQLAPKEVQVPDNDEILIIYLHMKKNGIEILLLLT